KGNPPASVPPGSDRFRNVKKRSKMIVERKRAKTTPTPPAKPLTPRQLAAARLVCQGFRTIQVARQLTTTVQTINRWRRMPAFAHELRRLHELLVRGSFPPAPTTRAPRPAEKSITKFHQAQMGEFVAGSLKRFGWK